jgi:thioredoxin-related protein
MSKIRKSFTQVATMSAALIAAVWTVPAPGANEIPDIGALLTKVDESHQDGLVIFFQHGFDCSLSRNLHKTQTTVNAATELQQHFTFLFLPYSKTQEIVGMNGTRETVADFMSKDLGIRFLPAMVLMDASGNVLTVEPVGGDNPAEVASSLETYIVR